MGDNVYPYVGSDYINLISGTHDDNQVKCLSLSRVDHVSLVIDVYDAADSWQQWLVIRSQNAIALWHMDTGSKLVCAQDGTLSLRFGPGGPANVGEYAEDELWTMVAVSPPSHSIWDWVQATFTDLFVDVTRYYNNGFAVRPLFDDDRNLNVLGNGPYPANSIVAAWDGWDGGDANEVWLPKLVTGQQ